MHGSACIARTSMASQYVWPAGYANEAPAGSVHAHMRVDMHALGKSKRVGREGAFQQACAS